MIIGQDKCIFKQYLFSKGFWIPEKEAQGLMVSSFCCGKLEFRSPILKTVLDKINQQCEHENYCDKKSSNRNSWKS